LREDLIRIIEWEFTLSNPFKSEKEKENEEKQKRE